MSEGTSTDVVKNEANEIAAFGLKRPKDILPVGVVDIGVIPEPRVRYSTRYKERLGGRRIHGL